MKIRQGFVSNSSSSSFIISKKKLSEEQIEKIKYHIYYAKNMLSDGMKYARDEDMWDITETEDEIKGEVSMDNFDMFYFLHKIGISNEDIEV